MTLQNILDELATMPIEVWPEPTDKQEQEDAAEPVITLVLYEESERAE